MTSACRGADPPPHACVPGSGTGARPLRTRRSGGPGAPLRWSLNLNAEPERAASASTDPSSESWHWFVLDLAAARTTAATLYGVDLVDGLGPIDPAIALSTIAESVRWYGQHEPASVNQAVAAAHGPVYVESGVLG